MAAKPLALRFARVFTVVLALSVLAYLVRDAQIRADSRTNDGASSPVLSTTEAAPEDPSVSSEQILVEPAEGVGARGLEHHDFDNYVLAPEPPWEFLHSSKVMPLGVDLFPPPAPQGVVVVNGFLHTSKSGVFRLPSLEPADDAEPESVD